jgi:hypothetical protein
MADVRLYMNKVNRWENLDTAVTTNQVPNLEGSLPKLRDKSKRMRELYAQHSAHAAARQVITQEMQQLIEEGDQVVRVVREAVKDHYGKRNEKLVEFGVQPLRAIAEKRRRSRKKLADQTPADPAAFTASTPDSAK